MFPPKSLAAAALLAVAAAPALAASCGNPAQLAEAAERLAGYSDVLTDYSCEAPANAAQTLICGDDNLTEASLIATRSYVYAYENAKGEETDHANPPRSDDFIAVRDACTDAACLCDAFSSHTNDNLGGLSPYTD
jgi:hypothetical protein